MPNRTTFHKVLLIFSVAFILFWFYSFSLYEDAFHDEERTVASADYMLEELKVSLIPDKMEIVHELEKGNSPRGIVKHNWDCSESFHILGISLLWLESHCCGWNLTAVAGISRHQSGNYEKCSGNHSGVNSF